MATGTQATGGRQGWFSRFLNKKRSLPKVPLGTRVYAVGDIHGRMDLLEKMLVQIVTHAGQEKRLNSLVFLGDYVDRGPQSKNVVSCLLRLKLPGWDIVCLRGNHDQAVLDFIENASFYRAWREFGGAETLLSYGVTPPRFDNEEAFAQAHDDFQRKCPESHLEFLRGLPFFHIVGDYMFVHAGVRPGIALDRQAPEDMMWIRDEFLFSDLRLDKVIVHGHSPSERPVLRTNHIGVDTGAYATGCLTAVVLEGQECTFLSTIGTERTI